MSSRQSDPRDTVILDIGSETVKAGFGGEYAPHSLFPSIVGWPRQRGMGGMMLGHCTDGYIGNDALCNRGLLNVSQPISRGEITSLDDCELLIHHALFRELKAAPENHSMIFAHRTSATTDEKEKILTTLFESFNVPAVHLVPHCVLSTIGSARSTALAVESGHGITEVVPVWEGTPVSHSALAAGFGGLDVSEGLASRLIDKGLPISTPADYDMVEDIKKAAGLVSLYRVDQLDAAPATNHVFSLPDGGHIVVDAEDRVGAVASVPTQLLNMTAKSIMLCSAALRPHLRGNVVLSGGNTLFDGLQQRFSLDLAAELLTRGDSGASVSTATPEGANRTFLATAKAANTTLPVSIVALPQRQYLSFAGAAILACLPLHRLSWLTKAEYDEKGVSVLHEG